MEQATLISELIQGMELVKQLRQHLDTSSSSVESMELLVQKILCSYEKALRILKFNEPISMVHPQQIVGATSGVPGSPLSINGSPRSDDIDKDNQDTRDVSKKRKMMPRWTDHVRVSSESLLEGTHDDGYSWRKYGQKDILGAKYPRSYYRCTYRHMQNCWAAKQVQRSDDDPTIFEITYRGTHICARGNQAVPPPASPEKREHKSTNLNNNYNQQLQSQEILSSLQEGLMVNTDGLDNTEMAPSFSFPSTSFGWLKSENHSFSPSGVHKSENHSFSPSGVHKSENHSFSPSGVLKSENHSFSPSGVHKSENHSFSPSGVLKSENHSFSPSGVLDNTNILNSFSSPFTSPARPELNYFSASQYEMNNFGGISANTSATNSPIVDLDFSLDQVELDQDFQFDSTGFFS